MVQSRLIALFALLCVVLAGEFYVDNSFDPTYYTTCQIFGDPHWNTFDGRIYTWMALPDSNFYIFVAKTVLVWAHVYVCGGDTLEDGYSVTCIDYIHIRNGDTVIKLTTTGELYTTDPNLDEYTQITDQTAQYSIMNNAIVLPATNGWTVQFDPNAGLDIKVSTANYYVAITINKAMFYGLVGGACGYYDNCIDDEYMDAQCQFVPNVQDGEPGGWWLQGSGLDGFFQSWGRTSAASDDAVVNWAQNNCNPAPQIGSCNPTPPAPPTPAPTPQSNNGASAAIAGTAGSNNGGNGGNTAGNGYTGTAASSSGNGNNNGNGGNGGNNGGSTGSTTATATPATPAPATPAPATPAPATPAPATPAPATPAPATPAPATPAPATPAPATPAPATPAPATPAPATPAPATPAPATPAPATPAPATPAPTVTPAPTPAPVDSSSDHCDINYANNAQEVAATEACENAGYPLSLLCSCKSKFVDTNQNYTMDWSLAFYCNGHTGIFANASYGDDIVRHCQNAIPDTTSSSYCTCVYDHNIGGTDFIPPSGTAYYVTCSQTSSSCYNAAACADNCNYNGKCENGKCVCDDGYSGATCATKGLTNAAKIAVITAGVLAAIIIGAVAFVALSGYGGVKGYQYMKEHQVSGAHSNPLYNEKPTNNNPFYNGKN